MNDGRERLASKKRERILSRDAVLFQADLTIESIASKPEVVASAPVVRELNSYIAPAAAPEEAKLVPAATSAVPAESEEFDRATYIARMQQEIASTWEDIEGEAA